MSIAGIEEEIKWVKNKVSKLRYAINNLDNEDILEAFEDLDSNIDDLIDECEDTISSVQNL
ncbi:MULTISPECIES: hypothetical protein [Terrisporobacter]|uniref:Uncharacterized protein n=1 Tax=Terrisporobacter muris TaxID=2963284 RepID=A0A9X2MAC9_9FIRM|nr:MULTISPECIES: hypothetical protein [Terrisporobacter]MCC3668064.1 hypothetical protein [Terrisporobacter mayombei]MCR1823777.1 hypothetical protein [Terrisporobacter muris]